jgi:hypothetical protein
MWTCDEAKASSHSLEAVKAKINRLIQRQAKAEGAPAIRIKSGWRVAATPVLILRRTDPTFDYRGPSRADGTRKKIERVQYVPAGEGKRATIDTDELSHFAADTPETARHLAELARLRDAEAAATAKADAYEEAIPRLTLKELKAMLPTEGENDD